MGDQVRKAIQIKLDLSLPEEAVLASSVDFNDNEIAQAYQIELKKKFPQQKNRDQVANVIYAGFGWLETFRHLFARSVNLAATLSYTPSFGVATPALPFLSLFCGVRLVLDTVQLAWDVIAPRTEAGKKLSYYERFKNSLNTDGRAKRMRNDIVWFGVNLASILLAPLTFGTSLWIPQAILMAGFAFDTVNEASQTSELKKRKNIINEIDSKIKEIDVEIATLEKTHRSYSAQLTSVVQQKLLLEKQLKTAENNPQLKEQIKVYEAQRNSFWQQKMDLKLADTKTELEAKRVALIHMKEKVQAETQSLKRTIIYSVAASFVVAVAMAVCIFCPPSIPVIIGAAIAVGVGSILDGFGRKLYNKVKNVFNKPAKSVATEVTVAKTDIVSTQKITGELKINIAPEISHHGISTTRSPACSDDFTPPTGTRRYSYSENGYSPTLLSYASARTPDIQCAPSTPALTV